MEVTERPLFARESNGFGCVKPADGFLENFHAAERFAPRTRGYRTVTTFLLALVILLLLYCRYGVFVYRLGHGPLKAERRVRFPYALPIRQIANNRNGF